MVATDKKSDSTDNVGREEEDTSSAPKECSTGHSKVVETGRTSYAIFFGCQGKKQVERPEWKNLRLSASARGPQYESQPCSWSLKVPNGPQRRGWATQSYEARRNDTKVVVLAEVARQKSKGTVQSIAKATELSPPKVDGVLRRAINAKHPTVQRTVAKRFTPPNSEVHLWRLSPIGEGWLIWAVSENLCHISRDDIENCSFDFQGIVWT